MHLSPEEVAIIKAGLEHDAPGDCWATGPLTGNPVEDLIMCPGCRALKIIKRAEKRENTKWIYRYLRADREEIDMGPYDSKKDAENAMKSHASFGALTEGPIEIDKDYELFKG